MSGHGAIMDVEHILHTLNQHGVDYILIGGMNFLFNHAGPITYDVDVFVNDTEANRVELNFALKDLQCEWGAQSDKWTIVPDDPKWLERQAMYCLTSPYGALDIFRSVKGLDDGFSACKARAELRSMPNGEFYYSLCDEDMLRSQECLELKEQKGERVKSLREAIAKKRKQNG